MNLDNLSMTGGALTLRKTEVATTKLKRLADQYTEHAKLVFLFDDSGSMCARLSPGPEWYIWTPENLTEARKQITNAIATANAKEPTTYKERALLDMADEAQGPQGQLSLTADDEELKRRIISNFSTDQFGIELDRSKGQLPSRKDVMQRLAKQEIRARFDKYPRTRCAVIVFEDKAEVKFDDGDEDTLWLALDHLNCHIGTGGTDILAAIRKGMDVCRAKPSPIGLHHFIVVTDGSDGEADRNIGEWIPVMKASGIVLDYIHIGNSSVNEGMQKACAELGGEFVGVTTEKDLEIKFLAAVGRLMLPPAPTE